MSEVTTERFCPLCEQMISSEKDLLKVKILMNKYVSIHKACAEKVADVLLRDATKDS
jgi:hypothetical protein